MFVACVSELRHLGQTKQIVVDRTLRAVQEVGMNCNHGKIGQLCTIFASRQGVSSLQTMAFEIQGIPLKGPCFVRPAVEVRCEVSKELQLMPPSPPVSISLSAASVFFVLHEKS